jgi:hypothetical protein
MGSGWTRIPLAIAFGCLRDSTLVTRPYWFHLSLHWYRPIGLVPFVLVPLVSLWPSFGNGSWSSNLSVVINWLKCVSTLLVGLCEYPYEYLFDLSWYPTLRNRTCSTYRRFIVDCSVGYSFGDSIMNLRWEVHTYLCDLPFGNGFRSSNLSVVIIGPLAYPYR